MSSSCTPRITRSSGPSGKLTRHNYRRRALPHLLADFEGRCAYSMRHIKLTGKTGMHVDHINPRLKEPARHRYANLAPACAQCNGKKSANWPSSEQIKARKRFLDPCAEQDYGKHIFEDPETGELIGATKEGRYHIDMLDLNAETFVWERRFRAAYRKAGRDTQMTVKGSFGEVSTMQHTINEIVRGSIDILIPPIPAPPN